MDMEVISSKAQENRFIYSHKPVDDFGALFFTEWDFDQWNLCWNLLANCIQLYLTFGVVQAPGERLEERKLRHP